MEIRAKMRWHDQQGCHKPLRLVLNSRWWLLSRRLDLCQVVVRDVLQLWWLASSYWELLKEQALGDALCPGAQGHPGVPSGRSFWSTSLYKVLLLDILKAAIRESVSKMVADLGGWHSGSLLGPLAEPLPPLVAFHLLQDQLQMESAAVPHQPVPQPQGNPLLYKTKVG